eukprot:EC722756.1.p1 GENE.EC722756.1~~EC722756.1.p1  ORF type:complete len:128 (+),score=28.18 EC722756.1:43-426(+)
MGKGDAKKKSAGPADEKKSGKLSACNHVKARHILCEKQGKIMEAYAVLQEQFISQDKKVDPSVFGQLAEKYSECPSGKRGGDLGWFPRGKMEGKFQEVAFGLAPGQCSEVFKGSNGYHIVLCMDRKA